MDWLTGIEDLEDCLPRAHSLVGAGGALPSDPCDLTALGNELDMLVGATSGLSSSLPAADQTLPTIDDVLADMSALEGLPSLSDPLLQQYLPFDEHGALRPCVRSNCTGDCISALLSQDSGRLLRMCAMSRWAMQNCDGSAALFASATRSDWSGRKKMAHEATRSLLRREPATKNGVSDRSASSRHGATAALGAQSAAQTPAAHASAAQASNLNLAADADLDDDEDDGPLLRARQKLHRARCPRWREERPVGTPAPLGAFCEGRPLYISSRTLSFFRFLSLGHIFLETATALFVDGRMVREITRGDRVFG